MHNLLQSSNQQREKIYGGENTTVTETLKISIELKISA